MSFSKSVATFFALGASVIFAASPRSFPDPALDSTPVTGMQNGRAGRWLFLGSRGRLRTSQGVSARLYPALRAETKRRHIMSASVRAIRATRNP